MNLKSVLKDRQRNIFKKFFTSLLVREMQIKTDLKFHLTLVRMDNVQKSKWKTRADVDMVDMKKGSNLLLVGM